MNFSSLETVSPPAAHASQGIPHLFCNGSQQFQPLQAASGTIWRGGMQFGRAVQLGFHAGQIASLDGEQEPSGCPS
jgi:hypothetical protein